MNVLVAAVTALAWLALGEPAPTTPAAPGRAAAGSVVTPAADAAPAPAPAPEAEAEATSASPPAEPAPPAEPPAALPPPPPSSPPPPLPPPPPAPSVIRYGDRGTSDLSLALGYGDGGLIVGAGFRRFFWTGLGPGLEGTAQLGGDPKIGLLLASLRAVAVRASGFAFTVTPKGGRVALSGHDDGWAIGGDAALIFMLAPGAALELGYEALWLKPASFCADLDSCVLRGPIFGLRLMF